MPVNSAPSPDWFVCVLITACLSILLVVLRDTRGLSLALCHASLTTKRRGEVEGGMFTAA